MAELPAAHPSDIELLELVEGDLDEAAADVVRTHVSTCRECAAEIAAVQSARTTLRATPALRLPDGRLDELIAALPHQDVQSGDLRSFIRSRKRILAVLAPAAAALAAVVIAFAVTSGGGEGSDAQEAGGAATQAAAAEAGAAESLQAAPGEDSLVPVVRVQGPPRAIVRILRQAGFTARRSEGTVIVVGARPAKVKKALADRPRGDVPVVVAP